MKFLKKYKSVMYLVRHAYLYVKLIAQIYFKLIYKFEVADFIPEVRRTLEKSPTVCRNWRTVANSMRLHHTTIQDIEENNRFRTSNAIYDVLQHWVDECGNQKATFGSLIDILQTERMAFAAGLISIY